MFRCPRCNAWMDFVASSTIEEHYECSSTLCSVCMSVPIEIHGTMARYGEPSYTGDSIAVATTSEG